MESCPEPKPDCPFAQTALCGLTKHHDYWPKKEYSTKIEKRFRELKSHVRLLPNCEHREFHLNNRPPVKPPLKHMVAVLYREANNGKA